MRRIGRLAVPLAVSASLLAPATASAQSIAVRSSFRIGGGPGSVLCLAQSMASDPTLTSMFDRGYSIVCRDASVPIGQVHALRLEDQTDPAGRLVQARKDRATCASPRIETVENIGAVEVLDCHLVDNSKVPYRVYQYRTGRTYYSAEGLGGYESALKIALRSIVTDRPVPGEVDVALTGAGDPAAFARVQAGTLDRSRALAEAYRRNNSGAYAESAEFFGAVTRGELGRAAQAEALVNEALQKSNLGYYLEADDLLKRAGAMLGNDPLVARQLRNYRAMHLLNQGLAEEALAELDKPLPDAAQLPVPAIRALNIDSSIAARLNADAAASDQLGAGANALQLEEKVQILEAQVDLLRGPALRLLEQTPAAIEALKRAETRLASVRGGRLPAIIWMRAQIEGELGAIAEAEGKTGEAATHFAASVTALEIDYPGSAVLQSARGRQAGFFIRSGNLAEATKIYRVIVDANLGAGNSTPALARLLAPYADMLLKRGSDFAAVAELFKTSQVMIRPGVAQTQAVLARELSGGSDEASRLFRQSVTLTRQIERTRSELARIALASEVGGAIQPQKKQSLEAQAAEFERDQVATQASLAAYPQYRAIASDVLALGDLQKSLRPGEAYYKLTVIDELVFALLVTPERASAFKLEANANELEDLVNRIRRTISTTSGEETVTFPFDVGLSQNLYRILFAPIEGELASIRHLVFEPDGAMMRLTPNLLVRDRDSVDAYVRRATAKGGDVFDFTGVRWLGRDIDISTAVSARAFRDVRNAPRAKGARNYLGLGENSRPDGREIVASADGMVECLPPLAAWNNPISPRELKLAQGIFGIRNADIVTQAAFSDSAIKGRGDLKDYRILHFATHGLVTPANPNCATEPALLTSFGTDESDGLLTFREIFDLRLDADLVILSACDTAAGAGSEAARLAGVRSGGATLDGLVRAFVGAGGRLVIASHWQVPDEFNATERLIGGIFSAQPGVSAVSALRQSQRRLMDDARTSHPYYWAAFSVIGDGQAPVREPTTEKLAGLRN